MTLPYQDGDWKNASEIKNQSYKCGYCDNITGSNKDWNFFKYIEYLDANHYIPPNGKVWVDYIRTKGNEANHEIVIMQKDDAFKLLTFVEMLLKFIYEFQSMIAPSEQPQ